MSSSEVLHLFNSQLLTLKSLFDCSFKHLAEKTQVYGFVNHILFKQRAYFWYWLIPEISYILITYVHLHIWTHAISLIFYNIG